MPLDGLGAVAVPYGKVISPVFMIWMTLLSMYITNCIADHCAVRAMNATHVSQLRRNFSDPTLTSIIKRVSEVVEIKTKYRSKSADVCFCFLIL